MSQKKRFYAVKSGRNPGIYSNWEACRAQVESYSNADYKGFSTRKEAEDYLNGRAAPQSQPSEIVQAKEPITISQSLPGPAHDRHPLKSAKQVVLYTDGACTGNPGPGGYGAILIHGDSRKELSAGFRLTTNNRMEILGCIVGLQSLNEPCDVTIYSDSKYVVNAMTQSWALKWRSRGWKRKLENGELVNALNADLWAQMLVLCDRHRVQFQWVRGHNGNEGNERCDALARAAAAATNLGIDVFYENPNWRDEVFEMQASRIPQH
jgi:ribonuclease HI